MDTNIPLETLSKETREELKKRGLDWKLHRLESCSGGFLKFATTSGTLSQVVDLSIAYFTTQDAKGWTRQKAIKELELLPPNTAETVSQAVWLSGTLYAEGRMLKTQTKQLCVISGSGVYCSSRKTSL